MTDDTDQWTCSYCGRSEHDEIHVMDEGIEVDVTCRSVYFTFVDEDGELQFPGMAFDHDEFEDIIEHYRSSVGAGEDQ